MYIFKGKKGGEWLKTDLVFLNAANETSCYFYGCCRNFAERENNYKEFSGKADYSTNANVCICVTKNMIKRHVKIVMAVFNCYAFKMFGITNCRQLMESQIGDLILATDISQQNEYLSMFRSHLDRGDLCLENPNHRHFILQVIFLVIYLKTAF